MFTPTHPPHVYVKHSHSLFRLALFILAFGMLTVFKMNAQGSGPVTDAAPEFSFTLQHTTVVVSDFEKSRDFYLGLLQLKEVPTDFLPENQMFVSAGGKLELHVGEVPGVKIEPSNFNHFALTVNDFDGFLAYLKSKGIVYSGLGGGEDYYVQKRPDGVRQTWIQDPDGYWIEFNDMK